MSTPEPENTTFKTVFLINLVVYNPVKPSTKKKSEEKVNKLKKANLYCSDCWRLHQFSSCSTCNTWEDRVQGHPKEALQLQIYLPSNEAVSVPSKVRIGRIDHRVPRMKHRDWTHRVPRCEYPIGRANVWSFFAASSPNISISGLRAMSAMLFMNAARFSSFRSRARRDTSLRVIPRRRRVQKSGHWNLDTTLWKKVTLKLI
jgi:hypothetical protein